LAGNPFPLSDLCGGCQAATGTPTEAGDNQVSGSFQVICQARPPYPLPYLSQLAYTYQPETDTLIDIWGVIWSRR
jgi:hypothetical protein